jgi:hypothetical protein
MTRLLGLLGVVPGHPLRGFMIGCLWVGATCLVACVVLAQLPVNPVWAIVAGCFAGSALVSLLVTTWVSRPLARDMRQIRQGDHFAHWRYSAEEWAHFEDAEWGQARRDASLAPVFGAVLAVVMGSVAGFASGDLVTGLALGGILLAIGLLVAVTTWIGGRLRHRRRSAHDAEVYISALGVIQPGDYTPIRAMNVRLTKAEIVTGDVTTLRLTTESTTENLTTRSHTVRIPVPRGREDEAAQVTRRLIVEAGARG